MWQKLPPSVPCNKKSRREPWHIPSGVGLGIDITYISVGSSEQPVPRSGNGCLFQKDNGIRPVKKPGHTRRAKGSFHGQQEQGLSRKLLIHHSGQRHPVLFWHLPKEAQAVRHTDKYDWEVITLRKRCCGTCQWHTKQEFQLENLNLDIQQMKNVVKMPYPYTTQKAIVLLRNADSNANARAMWCQNKTYKINHNKVDPCCDSLKYCILSYYKL